MASQLEGFGREVDTTTEKTIQRIAESVADGRLENVRHRKERLFSLHVHLARDASAICHALALKETGNRKDEAQREAEVEYYLALDAVRHFYDSIDTFRELRNDRRVDNGRNHETRRVGYGLVAIRPSNHSRFYSIIVPLAAALSAGNCVVVEMPKANQGDENYHIDTQLRLILTRALAADIFGFTADIDKVLDRSDLESPFVLFVDQRGPNSSDSSITARHHLASLNNAPTLAIVDRTANVNQAVRIISQAKFSFGGTSPYAPDLILVNEFVRHEFLEKFQKVPNVNIEVHGFGDRSSLVANIEKHRPRTIAVAPFSSLVDVVTAIKPGTQLLAGYIFSEPRTAKYLSQYLPCAVSYINQIPTHLLVGPAAPAVTMTTASPDLLYRYTRDMFSRPRPQIVEQPPLRFGIIDHHLRARRGNRRTFGEWPRFLQQVRLWALKKEEMLRMQLSLIALARRQLEPVRRPNHEDIGFFEAGFLLGAGLVIVPILGSGVFSLGRWMLSER